jgi:hypothetical protein
MINNATRNPLVIFAAITATALGSVVALNVPEASGSTTTARSSKGLPACQQEDGSGQRGACWWNGGRNGKGHRYVINNGQQTVVINSLRSCRALANVGTWRSKGEDGVMIFNGATLARELHNSKIELGWSSKRLHRECAGWLSEYANDQLK